MKASKGSKKTKAKDLPAGRTGKVTGGSKIAANAHEMKKSLIGNIPR